MSEEAKKRQAAMVEAEVGELGPESAGRVPSRGRTGCVWR